MNDKAPNEKLETGAGESSSDTSAEQGSYEAPVLITWSAEEIENAPLAASACISYVI
jgi:hypothetical protein